ncbi:Cholinephosphotransferase 1 [Taenia crassiceps]|uniref:Cholinephosphotransferase 1 n=1 Tax=Taenia crassiceps TaxID=6207 RepID=A0ABR4QH90_9CEST
MRRGRGNEPLRPEQLQTIKEHRYASRGSSISERYFQVFWCSLVPFIPKCIAPNTLTLTGLIINSVPSWSLVLAAFRFRLDVTEGQIGVMLALLWTAVFGVGFWSNRVPIIGMPLKYVPFLVISMVAILNISHFFSIISQGGAGKAGTTVANTSVLFPAFPFGLVLFLAIMVAVRSPLHLYTNHLVLFLITFGFVAVKVILKLVVDHMSKSEMTLIDSVLVGPFALFFNQYFNCPIPESFVLWCCCILAVADVLLYSSNVCIQIADYLNIYIFRVSKPPVLLVRQSLQSQQHHQLDVNAGFPVSTSSVRPSHYQRSRWGPH